jgi:cytochrome P450
VNLAANRDPEAFPNPDTLDLGRNPGNHLGFGVGIHYCLGAPLSRLEGQFAITRLLEAFPGLRLDAEPSSLTWHGTMLSRGLTHLPVSLVG